MTQADYELAVERVVACIEALGIEVLVQSSGLEPMVFLEFAEPTDNETRSESERCLTEFEPVEEAFFDVLTEDQSGSPANSTS